MSNAGQAVTGIVGGVVGFFFGGPTGALYGFQLGLAAGTLLFPTQLPGVQGPRLGDGQQTVSQVGAPIPWVIGANKVGGIVIWASGIREVASTQTVGGKGPPEQKQTTYEYYRSWAVLLTDGEIAGVRRIWFNGKLVYDATPQRDDESDPDFRSRLMANELFLEKVTIYLGTEDQMPDPTMEAHLGAGNVPAYRGYSYVVFNDMLLLPEDGSRMPASMQFEVYTAGAVSTASATQYSTTQLFPWIRAGDPRDPPLNPLNEHTFLSAFGGGTQTSGRYDSPAGAPWSSLSAALNAKEAMTGRRYTYAHGHDLDGLVPLPGDAEVGANVRGWTNMGGAPEAYTTEALTIGLHYNQFDADAWTYVKTGETFVQSMDRIGVTAGSDRIGMVNDTDADEPSEAELIYRTSSAEDLRPLGWDLLGIDVGFNRFISFNLRITCRRVPRAPWDPCEDPRSIPIHGVEGYVILNGELQKCGPWTLKNGTARALAAYTTSENAVTQYPLNPTRPQGHPDYNDQGFWEEAYNAAVARGDMPAGLTYGVHYPVTQSFYYEREASSDVVELNPIPLSDVVSAICDMVGQRVDLRYDVSDLTNRFIIGYKIANPTSARGAIEPLRSVGLFDCIEDGITLRFPTRGKSPVATLTTEDLGAHFVDEPHVPLTTSQKLLEFELPRQVRVHYQCLERDYEPGEELSPARVDTKAESTVDVELAVCITPDQAAQVAEILHRDLWAARYLYTSRMDVSNSHIQPSDCVLLPVDGVVERVRLTSVVDHLPNLREFNFVRDDDGSYVSTATGTETFPAPPVLAFYGPVEGVLLDLPLLDIETETADAGFYFAARPLITGGAFRGASLLRSSDDAGFEAVASVQDATPMGTLLEDVGLGPTTIFDWGNEIIVEMQYGELESRSMEDVLNGANAAAIGSDGRWEILQFMSAELLYGTTYRLTGLLRGRRGTEYNVGRSGIGDRFVLLTAGTIARVPLSNDLVNQSIYYRTTVVGRPATTAESVTFTGRGSALRPFSPVHIEGEQQGNDWVFSWVRRDRLATDIDVPMSEETEDYEVDIMRNGEVTRTISVASQTATYTEAQQMADFGAVQSEVTIRVYQISAAVGRSYPAEATFEA